MAKREAQQPQECANSLLLLMAKMCCKWVRSSSNECEHEQTGRVSVGGLVQWIHLTDSDGVTGPPVCDCCAAMCHCNDQVRDFVV